MNDLAELIEIWKYMKLNIGSIRNRAKVKILVTIGFKKIWCKWWLDQVRKNKCKGKSKTWRGLHGK